MNNKTATREIQLLAEIARLEKQNTELIMIAGSFFKAYHEWVITADVVYEDMDALNLLSEKAELFKSLLGIVDIPNQ